MKKTLLFLLSIISITVLMFVGNVHTVQYQKPMVVRTSIINDANASGLGVRGPLEIVATNTSPLIVESAMTYAEQFRRIGYNVNVKIVPSCVDSVRAYQNSTTPTILLYTLDDDISVDEHHDSCGISIQKSNFVSYAWVNYLYLCSRYNEIDSISELRRYPIRIGYENKAFKDFSMSLLDQLDIQANQYQVYNGDEALQAALDTKSLDLIIVPSSYAVQAMKDSKISCFITTTPRRYMTTASPIGSLDLISPDINFKNMANHSIVLAKNVDIDAMRKDFGDIIYSAPVLDMVNNSNLIIPGGTTADMIDDVNSYLTSFDTPTQSQE